MHSEQWGLTCGKKPCFSARLVQEGNRLHFLADRAGFTGKFSTDEALRLDQVFPLIMKQLEQKLSAGELNSRRQQCVTLHHIGLTCKADTLGSHGYLYIAIYPSATATG
ncbi:TPA: type IV toxin-antitoxin system YeeU family antitoxin [Enterobacter hormaechei subsp. hoffmannii]|nr:type IV toxin-antitoxin system YeeU family antitoxin [Enterobacter hormaechei subsp. hoffmannii]